jgi:glycosyltransferase involved in cell wall biosynthesis
VSKKIKVLVIGSYHVLHTSRPEAEIIVSLAKAGFEMTVMTHGETEYAHRFEQHGVRVIPFHPEHKFRRAESQRIRSELIAGNYDILQLYTSKAIVNGIRAARGLNVKVVLYRGYAGHVHWYDPAAYLKYLHPRVDKIVCNSIGVEQYFQKQLFLPHSKLVTINKGHDPQWYAHVQPADLSEFDILPSAFVVSCMANVRPMKGIEFLIEAMNNIPADADVHLILGGVGTDDDAFVRLRKASYNAGKIHLLGYRDDALNIVASSDVFALASIKGESITRAVQEAMSIGVTPVITDIPGNVELVEDRISGLVVPMKDPKALANAILELYHNRPLLEQLSAGARAHIANKLNHNQTVAGMGDLYRSLVAD